MNTSTPTEMDHWLLEGLLRPNIVAEESEDGGSEESSTEEVDFEARVSELEEELQYAKAETVNIAPWTRKLFQERGNRDHCLFCSPIVLEFFPRTYQFRGCVSSLVRSLFLPRP